MLEARCVGSCCFVLKTCGLQLCVRDCECNNVCARMCVSMCRGSARQLAKDQALLVDQTREKVWWGVRGEGHHVVLASFEFAKTWALKPFQPVTQTQTLPTWDPGY